MRSIFNFHPFDKLRTIFNSQGVTLIELLLTISIIGILSAVSTVGLIGYTRTSRLNAAANQLLTTLHVAKSNALSQVKDPALCGATDVLGGYKVITNNDCKTYDLNVVCGGVDYKVGNTRTLPDNVTFTSTTQKSFLFPVLKGGAIGDPTVGVSGFGKAECIAVSSQGVISSNALPCPPSGCIPPAPTPTPTGVPPTPIPTPTPTPIPTPIVGCADGTTDQDFGFAAGKKVHGCDGNVSYASAGTLCKTTGWHTGDVILDTGLASILSGTASNNGFGVRWIYANGDPGPQLGSDPAFCWGTQAPCTIPQFEPDYHPGHYAFGNMIYISGASTLTNYGEIASDARGTICVEGPPPGPLTTKRVFVTSTFYTANLGGLSGADAKCQSRASAAGLGGTWVAWLSTIAVNAKERISDDKYVWVDGVTVVAFNKADLLDGFLGNAINKDEFSGITTFFVWTGTTTSGSGAGVQNCNDWTDGSGLGTGRRGYSGLSDPSWTYNDLFSCSAFSSLYCFEQ